MNQFLRSLDRKTKLTLASSTAIILGVFLTFLKIDVRLEFIGVFSPQSATYNYWNSGNGDGKYLILLAILSVILVLSKWKKSLWVTFITNIGIIIYSVFDIIDLASSIRKGPLGPMAEAIYKNTEISIIPREGLFFILLGLILLGIAVFTKPKTPLVHTEL